VKDDCWLVVMCTVEERRNFLDEFGRSQEVAEYAVSHGIDHEPAFSWWVPNVLKKRDRIISAVNKRYLKRTHKFGIEVPKSVADAMRLDTENGNTLWMDAVALEIASVNVSFKHVDDGEEVPVGYQYIDCHMVFDVKLDGFRRKARMVAGGHMTEAPAVMTYASVVSRESVRIALTLAALNDLQVKASDVMNAYLTAPCEEKIWTILGPEFGGDAGKKALIVRALYGLKSAGASFSRHLADCMRELGYTSCKADPDIWMKEMVRPEDNFRYYAYILLYVDDVLCIHHDAENAYATARIDAEEEVEQRLLSLCTRISCNEGELDRPRLNEREHGRYRNQDCWWRSKERSSCWYAAA
jgi:hypothetical protein